MTNRIRPFSLVCVAGFVLAAAPAVVRAGEKGEEARIESKLKKDSDLKDVSVKCERVVTLTGKVATEADRTRAEHLANIPGVTKIDNQIAVTERADTKRIDDRAEAAKQRVQERADIEKNRIDSQAEAAKERADRADHHSGDSQSTLGEDISDTWITTKLKSRYSTESAFRNSTIHIETDGHGIVSLRGTVPTEAARRAAVDAARATKGVRDVRDTLTVVPAHE